MSENEACPHGEPFPGSTTEEHEIAFEEILDLIQRYHEEGREDGGYKAAREFAGHTPEILDTFLIAFLASEGTRILLEGDEETQVYAVLVAQVICAFEKRLFGKHCDSDVDNEHLFVFYKKRIPCDCLNELAAEVEEEESEGEPEPMATCANPSCRMTRPMVELNACAACGLVFYCNEECQTKHWPAHAKTCQIIQSQEERIRKNSLGELESRSPKRKVSNPGSPTKPRKQSNGKDEEQSPKKKRKEKKSKSSSHERSHRDHSKSKQAREKGELSPRNTESPKKKKKAKVKEQNEDRGPKKDRENGNDRDGDATSAGHKALRRKSSSHIDDERNNTKSKMPLHGSSSFGHVSSPLLLAESDALAFLFDDSDSDDSDPPMDQDLDQSMRSLLDVGGHKSESSLGGSHGSHGSHGEKPLIPIPEEMGGNRSDSSLSGSLGEKPLMTILEDSVNRSISDLFHITPSSPRSPLKTNQVPFSIEEEVEYKVSPTGPTTKSKKAKKSKRSSSKPRKDSSKDSKKSRSKKKSGKGEKSKPADVGQ